MAQAHNIIGERVIAGKNPIEPELHISNSDFLVLAAIFSAIGGIGIWEANELRPALYSQPAILFGSIGYFAYQTFYLDRKREPISENSPTVAEQP